MSEVCKEYFEIKENDYGGYDFKNCEIAFIDGKWVFFDEDSNNAHTLDELKKVVAFIEELDTKKQAGEKNGNW